MIFPLSPTEEITDEEKQALLYELKEEIIRHESSPVFPVDAKYQAVKMKCLMLFGGEIVQKVVMGAYQEIHKEALKGYYRGERIGDVPETIKWSDMSPAERRRIGMANKREDRAPKVKKPIENKETVRRGPFRNGKSRKLSFAGGRH